MKKLAIGMIAVFALVANFASAQTGRSWKLFDAAYCNVPSPTKVVPNLTTMAGKPMLQKDAKQDSSTQTKDNYLVGGKKIEVKIFCNASGDPKSWYYVAKEIVASAPAPKPVTTTQGLPQGTPFSISSALNQSGQQTGTSTATATATGIAGDNELEVTCGNLKDVRLTVNIVNSTITGDVLAGICSNVQKVQVEATAVATVTQTQDFTAVQNVAAPASAVPVGSFAPTPAAPAPCSYALDPMKVTLVRDCRIGGDVLVYVNGAWLAFYDIGGKVQSGTAIDIVGEVYVASPWAAGLTAQSLEDLVKNMTGVAGCSGICNAGVYSFRITANGWTQLGGPALKPAPDPTFPLQAPAKK